MATTERSSVKETSEGASRETKRVSSGSLDSGEGSKSSKKKRGSYSRPPVASEEAPKSKQAKPDDPAALKGRPSSEEAVHCTHAEHGCEWTGTSKELEAHLYAKGRRPTRSRQIVSVCMFVDVPCRSCGQPVLYKNLEKHETTECMKRQGTCEHCKQPFREYDKHMAKCKSLPLPCPNACPALLPRAELQQHVDQHCPNRSVQCPFLAVGCDFKGLQMNLPAHNKECHVEHMGLIKDRLNERQLNVKEMGHLFKLIMECLSQATDADKGKDALVIIERKLEGVLAGNKDIHGRIEELSLALNSTTPENSGTQLEELQKCRLECTENRGEVGELRKMVHEQKVIIQSQQEMLTELQSNHSSLTQKYQELLEKQAYENEALKYQCATLTEEMKRLNFDDLRQSTAQNHSKLLEHSRKFVKQEAKIAEQNATIEVIGRRSSTGTLPFYFTLTNFLRSKLFMTPIFSPPFYTHSEGYRMCLAVYTDGIGHTFSKHISVFIHLMRGEFDHKLVWPFQGSITIQLFNQLADENHQTATFNFSETTDPAIVGRVIGAERATYGFGDLEFFELKRLNKDAAKNTQYMNFNCLKFCVLRGSGVDASAHLLRRCRTLESFMMSVEHDVLIPPLEFSVPDFSEQKKQNEIWTSPAFYTHKLGYRMCLKVFPNGTEGGWRGYVSIVTCIMHGRFDPELHWPFRGNIEIEILNQVRDQDHCCGVITYTKETPETHCSRPIRHECSVGNGIPLFIAHESLGPDSKGKTIYVHNNILRIRVSAVTLENK